MSFADDVDGYQIPRARCSVGVWRESQDAETQAQFDERLRSAAPSRAIWEAMRARKFSGTEQTVSRHRRGDCKCPSPTT